MEVKEMTIEDVLKTPLFFENVKRQLTSLWNDREKGQANGPSPFLICWQFLKVGNYGK